MLEKYICIKLKNVNFLISHFNVLKAFCCNPKKNESGKTAAFLKFQNRTFKAYDFEAAAAKAFNLIDDSELREIEKQNVKTAILFNNGTAFVTALECRVEEFDTALFCDFGKTISKKIMDFGITKAFFTEKEVLYVLDINKLIVRL